MKPAGEQEVLRLLSGLLDPRLQCVPGGLRDLELHWALGLVLHDDGACRHLVAMTDIPDLERDEIAAAQLAVDAQVEEREFAHPALHLEADAQRPDVLELERCLLPDDPPLFQGSREVAVPAVPMMVSHRVEGFAGSALGSPGRHLLLPTGGGAHSR